VASIIGFNYSYLWRELDEIKDYEKRATPPLGFIGGALVQNCNTFFLSSLVEFEKESHVHIYIINKNKS
jgi:hypothetical protein